MHRMARPNGTYLVVIIEYARVVDVRVHSDIEAQKFSDPTHAHTHTHLNKLYWLTICIMCKCYFMPILFEECKCYGETGLIMCT